MLNHSWRTGLLAFALLFTAAQPIFAQRLPANYIFITYRKVAPENVEAFLKHTRTETKKIIQARIDSGGITGSKQPMLLIAHPAASVDINSSLLLSAIP